MRLSLGAGSSVGGGELDEGGMEAEEDLTASELSRFAALAIFEASSSVLRSMFAFSSSRFRLPGEGVVLGPFGCCPAAESLMGTLADSSAADAAGSLFPGSGFRLFCGRLASGYLKWSS